MMKLWGEYNKFKIGKIGTENKIQSLKFKT